MRLEVVDSCQLMDSVNWNPTMRRGPDQPVVESQVGLIYVWYEAKEEGRGRRRELSELSGMEDVCRGPGVSSRGNSSL